jgi:hypothetical protein
MAFSDGAASSGGAAGFGSLRASGPAFHASGVLLGNASAMIGPLVLCTVYLLARTLLARTLDTRTLLVQTLHLHTAVARVARTRFDLRIPLGAGGAVLALAAGDLIRRSNGTVDATLHRMLDNSTVFGFGFLAGMPGRIAVALLAGLLIAHAGDPARRPAAT